MVSGRGLVASRGGGLDFTTEYEDLRTPSLEEVRDQSSNLVVSILRFLATPVTLCIAVS